MMGRLAERAMALLFLALVPLAAPAAEQDLELSRLTVYGIFEVTEETGGTLYLYDKEFTFKVGQIARLQVPEYNPIAGADPGEVEIVATVSNRSGQESRDIEVRLAVIPQVATLIFGKGFIGEDPSTADRRATTRTAQWFGPLAVLRRTVETIPSRGSVDVVFERINLKELIGSYAARNLWPTALRFQASVEPKGPEKTLRNNTRTLLFPVRFPPY